jgi:hypothetical protein
MLNKLKIMKGITFIIHVEDLTQRASMGGSIWPIVQGSFLNIFFITHYEWKFSSINDDDWDDANVDLHKIF